MCNKPCAAGSSLRTPRFHCILLRPSDGWALFSRPTAISSVASWALLCTHELPMSGSISWGLFRFYKRRATLHDRHGHFPFPFPFPSAFAFASTFKKEKRPTCYCNWKTTTTAAAITAIAVSTWVGTNQRSPTAQGLRPILTRHVPPNRADLQDDADESERVTATNTRTIRLGGVSKTLFSMLYWVCARLCPVCSGFSPAVVSGSSQSLTFGFSKRAVRKQGLPRRNLSHIPKRIITRTPPRR